MKSSLIYLSNIYKKNDDKTIDYKSFRIKKIGVSAVRDIIVSAAVSSL